MSQQPKPIGAAAQAWSAHSYDQHARFVSELTADVLAWLDADEATFVVGLFWQEAHGLMRQPARRVWCRAWIGLQVQGEFAER